MILSKLFKDVVEDDGLMFLFIMVYLGVIATFTFSGLGGIQGGQAGGLIGGAVGISLVSVFIFFLARKTTYELNIVQSIGCVMLNILVIGIILDIIFGGFQSLFQLGLPLLIGVVFAEEILYWFDDEPIPLGRSETAFTIQKKTEAFLDILFGFGGAYGYYLYIKSLNELNFSSLVEPIVIGLVIIAAFVLFIVLNRLKYEGRKVRTPMSLFGKKPKSEST